MSDTFQWTTTKANRETQEHIVDCLNRLATDPDEEDRNWYSKEVTSNDDVVESATTKRVTKGVKK